MIDTASVPVEVLGLSVRSYFCLKRSSINTIEDLVSTSEDELMVIRNLGKVSLAEIKEKLSERGLSLRES